MATRGIAAYGRVIDPLVELRGPLGSGGNPLASWNAWRRERRERTANKDALNRLMLADKSFRTDTFLASARQAYADLLEAITSNRINSITPLVTEPCFLAIKRGIEAGIAETGFRQGAVIVDWLEAPSIVHARVAWSAGELNRTGMDAPDVAQLTVRAVTLQAPKASVLAGRDRELEAGGGSVPDANAALGEWAPVLDNASGHTFYWNAATGAVTWRKPSPAQWATGRTPFRVEAAGLLREVVVPPAPPSGGGGVEGSPAGSGPGSGSGAGAAAPLVRVTHNVVWERIMRTGAPPGLWRIAKL